MGLPVALWTVPFAFFGFWATTLAVGAAAASIPIIIHLLNRRRYQIVVWAAMRFLLNAQKQNTRRMRLEHLLLLIVRTLLIVLVVLAMASVMPWAEGIAQFFYPEGAPAAQNRTARIYKILVIDNSLSMAADRDGNQTVFERAKEMAIEMVRSSQQGDGFSVILLKNSGQGNPKDLLAWSIGQISSDRGAVVEKIKTLKQFHGNADVLSTLNMVSAKMAEVGPPYQSKEVCIFTDMQSATWKSPGQTDKEAVNGNPLKKHSKDALTKILETLQEQAKVVFVDVGEKKNDNLALTDLKISETLLHTGIPASIQATIHNYGTENHRDVKVWLAVKKADGEKLTGNDVSRNFPFKLDVVEQKNISINPEQQVSITFEYPFEEAGTYAVQIRLQEDQLEPDNVRTTIVRVQDSFPVLVVNGKPAKNRFQNATEYLSFNLTTPEPTEDNPHPLPLENKVILPVQLKDMSEKEFADYHCIFLCDVYSLKPQIIGKLKTHLLRGGGLVISMGDKVAGNLDFYNDKLFRDGQGLLPGKLLGVQEAPPGYNYYFNTGNEEAFRHPPLKRFAPELFKSTLRFNRFNKFMKMTLADNLQSGVDPQSLVQSILSFKLEAIEENPDPIPAEAWSEGPALVAWNPPLPPEDDSEEKKSSGYQNTAQYPGKVIVLTTTWNTDWNNWATAYNHSYTQMVTELSEYAMSGRLKHKSIVVGEGLEKYLLTDGQELDVRVYRPGSAQGIDQKTEGPTILTKFQWLDTDISGVYVMTVPARKTAHLFAVNVPATTTDQTATESDLTRLSASRFLSTYEDLDLQVVRQLGEIKHDKALLANFEALETKSGPVLANRLLLAVLGLLFLEVILALVFGRFSSVPGSTMETKPVKRWWPITIGVVASLLFITLAGVLLHAAVQDDLFGFLSRDLRRGMEAGLGIPAAAPGEGTRWDPHWNAFLLDERADFWLGIGLALAALLMVVTVYRLEGRAISWLYRILMGGLRLFLIFLALVILVPQLELNFQRQSWPDVVLLIDDSLSMGETDQYRGDLADKEAMLAKIIRTRLEKQLPEKIKTLETQLEKKRQSMGKKATPQLIEEVRTLQMQLDKLNSEKEKLAQNKWRPTRLQLVQALVKNENQDWVKAFLQEREMKVHIFHLDETGRAVKLYGDKKQPCDIMSPKQTERIDMANGAILDLTAHAKNSRLGQAVRQILDMYSGAPLSALVVLTDGVTTRGESLREVSRQAKQKRVPLVFVGVGEDDEIRDLELHDLQVADSVYVNDTLIVESRLTGKGFKKPFKVDVALKIKEQDGTETELTRQKDVTIDASGSSKRIQLEYTPTKEDVGERLIIVEAIPQKLDKKARLKNPALRLQKTISIRNLDTIKVLYVEGAPRYEYRFLKTLLEREEVEEGKKASIELDVLLIESDPNFPRKGDNILARFPVNEEQLFKYHVIIWGDVNPNSPKISNDHLKSVAKFVENHGGGFLMIAGQMHSPHKYRATPLVDILPIEPVDPPKEPPLLKEGYQLELTQEGSDLQMFRFVPNNGENRKIWQQLAPMYWWSKSFRMKPSPGVVLAVHPKQTDPLLAAQGKDSRLPLVVQQFIGSGRSLFFGFDGSWRWRFREDEFHFNEFWIQTIRYLAKNQDTRTHLILDKQTPYRQGDSIKVQVRFPSNQPPPEEVEVEVEYIPPDKDGKAGPRQKLPNLVLKKAKGISNFEGAIKAKFQGKYRFELIRPDGSSQQPDQKNPGAEATVIQPLGELERVRMDKAEMTTAARVSKGHFYTLLDADRLPEELPAGYRYPLGTAGPPHLLWNHPLIFVLFLGLLTAEWILRKRRHLL